MTKILTGGPLPNIPWEDRPAGYKLPVWRYSGNPIIGRDGNRRSNSVFNSAVVPYKGGFAGLFRCDSRSVSMDLFAGFSDDGVNWKIDDDPISFADGDAEIIKREYRYDPRVCLLDGKYYIEKITHSIGSGYKMALEMRRVEERITTVTVAKESAA